MSLKSWGYSIFIILDKYEIRIQNEVIHVCKCIISKFMGLGLIDIGFINLGILDTGFNFRVYEFVGCVLLCVNRIMDFWFICI